MVVPSSDARAFDRFFEGSHRARASGGVVRADRDV